MTLNVKFTHTSAFQRFKWDSSVCESFHNCYYRLPCVILKRSTVLVARVSHFLSAKVFPEWRLNPGFGTQKRSPFLNSLNRGVPSTEVIDTKTMWAFFRGQTLGPLNGSVLKERFDRMSHGQAFHLRTQIGKRERRHLYAYLPLSSFPVSFLCSCHNILLSQPIKNILLLAV